MQSSLTVLTVKFHVTLSILSTACLKKKGQEQEQDLFFYLRGATRPESWDRGYIIPDKISNTIRSLYVDSSEYRKFAK